MTKPVLCIFFLGRDFAVQVVSMKTVLVQGVYFCFKAKPANAKLATKKEKNVNNVILHSEITRISLKSWNFTHISKMDEEDEHSLSSLSWRSGNSSYKKWNIQCILLSETVSYVINNLLTELARTFLGNIGPRSWQYTTSAARSTLPRPRAIFPSTALPLGSI